MNTSAETPGATQNFAIDANRWSRFSFRTGDVVIASWGRSGTTWLQQIVGQLILGPDRYLNLQDVSPWIEHKAIPLPTLLERLRAQSHTRFVKTHLPADAITIPRDSRCIFIGRDGRDVAVSLYNFHRNHTAFAYQAMKEMTGSHSSPLPPPAPDFGRYFDEWLSGDGYPWWPFWRLIRSWWEMRNHPNVCLVHYADLLSDLDVQVRRIADFLKLDIPESRWQPVLDLCTFASMKAHSDSMFGDRAQKILRGGMSSFFRKGHTGEWRSLLTPLQISNYETRARLELTGECARWLASGGGADCGRTAWNTGT